MRASTAARLGGVFSDTSRAPHTSQFMRDGWFKKVQRGQSSFPSSPIPLPEPKLKRPGEDVGMKDDPVYGEGRLGLEDWRGLPSPCLPVAFEIVALRM